MLASEGIKLIQEQIDEHGDCELSVFADHGQSNETAYHVTIQYLDDCDEIIHQDDAPDYTGILTKTIEIS